jgi:hypothetical protein
MDRYHEYRLLTNDSVLCSELALADASQAPRGKVRRAHDDGSRAEAPYRCVLPITIGDSESVGAGI